MTKKAGFRRGRLFPILAAAALLLSLFFAGFPASAAEEHVVLTISNVSPGTDINPLIRFYASQDKGFKPADGPFTLRFEWKVEGMQRMNTTNKPIALVDYYSLNSSDEEGAEETFAKLRINEDTDGWVDARGNDGNYITFKEIVASDMGQLKNYGILNIGLLYSKGTLSIRNFRILNAAGKVVYSLDEDQDVLDLLEYAEDNGMANCSLKDIALINPEPQILTTGFGDNTAAVYVTMEEDGGAAPIATTTTHGLQMEDTTAAPVTTTGAADTTTEAEETTTTTEETTTSAAGETTGSSSRATTAPTTLNAGGAVENPGGGGGLPVGAIVAIVIAAVLVVAAGVIWILAIAGKIRLPFRLPFVKEDGTGPQE
ncbi:MAG TPA: hypothetical protein H9684_09455 [Firmicutes bacterium]|nr:hypothetical protein [Bacillota bacterium]